MVILRATLLIKKGLLDDTFIRVLSYGPLFKLYTCPVAV